MTQAEDTGGPAPAVDAHHHYWRAAEHGGHGWVPPEELARDFLPEELAPQLATAGVERTVVVQSEDSPAENDRLAGYAATVSSVAGLVGWLPLQHPAVALQELGRADTSSWCGVRCLVGRDPIPWLTSPGTVELFEELGRRGLAWDVVPVTAEQTREVVRLIELLPSLRVVVDHLARPPVEGGGWLPWADLTVELAAHEQVAMKLSVGVDVLQATRSWPGAELQRYVAWALDKFGVDRLMVASNWPVVLLGADYHEAFSGMVELARQAGVSDGDLDALRAGTAERWYALPRRPVPRP